MSQNENHGRLSNDHTNPRVTGIMPGGPQTPVAIEPTFQNHNSFVPNVAHKMQHGENMYIPALPSSSNPAFQNVQQEQGNDLSAQADPDFDNGVRSAIMDFFSQLNNDNAQHLQEEAGDPVQPHGPTTIASERTDDGAHSVLPVHDPVAPQDTVGKKRKREANINDPADPQGPEQPQYASETIPNGPFCYGHTDSSPSSPTGRAFSSRLVVAPSPHAGDPPLKKHASGRVPGVHRSDNGQHVLQLGMQGQDIQQRDMQQQGMQQVGIQQLDMQQFGMNQQDTQQHGMQQLDIQRQGMQQFGQQPLGMQQRAMQRRDVQQRPKQHRSKQYRSKQHRSKQQLATQNQVTRPYMQQPAATHYVQPHQPLIPQTHRSAPPPHILDPGLAPHMQQPSLAPGAPLPPNGLYMQPQQSALQSQMPYPGLVPRMQQLSLAPGAPLPPNGSYMQPQQPIPQHLQSPPQINHLAPAQQPQVYHSPYAPGSGYTVQVSALRRYSDHVHYMARLPPEMQRQRMASAQQMDQITYTGQMHHPTAAGQIHPPPPAQQIHQPTYAGQIHHPAAGLQMHCWTSGQQVHQATYTGQMYHLTSGHQMHHPTPGQQMHHPSAAGQMHPPPPAQQIYWPPHRLH